VLSAFRGMGKTPISQVIPWGSESRRKARNQRRKALAEVRAFVLKLNRARG